MAIQSGQAMWFFESERKPADPPQWMKELESKHGAMMLGLAGILGDYAGKGDLKAIGWFGIVFQRLLDKAVALAEENIEGRGEGEA